MKTIVLPKKTKRQPDFHINEIGDCGACVLAGLFDCTVKEAYERYKPNKPISAFTFYEMIEALWQAYYRKEATDVNPDCPEWRVHDILMQYGRTSILQSAQWYRYVKMGIQAGYYAICSVSLNGLGQFGSPAHDHWVLLNGFREKETIIKGPNDIELGRRIDEEIQVSCSVKYTEWMSVTDFLTKKGGFNVLLVKVD